MIASQQYVKRKEKATRGYRITIVFNVSLEDFSGDESENDTSKKLAMGQ